jgi:pantetheine-phosphate adenylyltransferase
MEKRRAIYPGSFDPITFGHLDLIRRALTIFDEVIVVVAVNVEKRVMFQFNERIEFVRRAVKGLKGVTVEGLNGLTVEYARKKQARALIRGLRATSDFDYEFQMALTNRKLSKEVDTVFLMPSESHLYLSSRLVKEIAFLGGDVSEFVPPFVARRLREALKSA